MCVLDDLMKMYYDVEVKLPVSEEFFLRILSQRKGPKVSKFLKEAQNKRRELL